MNLQSLFLVSQSIEAIIISLFFIYLTFLLVYLLRSIKKSREKVIEAANESIQTAEEVRSYVGKISQTILDYIIVRIMKSIKGKK